MFIRNKNYRQGIIISLVFCLQILAFAGFALPVMADTNTDFDNSAARLLNYYKGISTYNDWEALGLKSLGQEVKGKYKPAELTDESQATDYARTILGSIAAGSDKNKINSYITALQEKQSTDGSFGDTLNQSIWAVIALDFAQDNGFIINYQRDKVISLIRAAQDETGAFDEAGWGVDVDSTAHALIALARDKEKNSSAINKAITYLKSKQLDCGAFDNWGPNGGSTAAVIEALIALGMDPLDDEWVKDQNMIDALLQFQSENGMFFYVYEGENVDSEMSTYLALLAVADQKTGVSKYCNKIYEEQQTIEIVNQSASSFSLDSDARVVLQISNQKTMKIDTLVIAALYDKKMQAEKMLTYAYVDKELDAGESVDFGCGFTIPAQGSYEVRVYVWDDWSSKNPYTDAITIPVK